MPGLDVKTIAIGVVIGLIIGGGIGYMAIQPEINTLKNNIATYEETIATLEASIQETEYQLSAATANLSQTYNQLQKALDEKTAAQAELNDYKTFYQDMWDKYNDLIQKYNSLQGVTPVGEMVTTPIPGIVNGGFDDNTNWVLQGIGDIRRNAAYLHRSDTFSTFLSQTVTVDQKDIGIQFDVKPQPNGGTITLQVYFGDALVFEEAYTGHNTDYNYTTKTIHLWPLLDALDLMRQLNYQNQEMTLPEQFTLKFSIPQGPRDGSNVIIDNVTLVSITYQPSEPAAQ